MPNDPTIANLIAALGLEPHPAEGGYYAETYRSPESLRAVPGRYNGNRCFGTAIYYLLTPDTVSAMHRLASDEIFHHYLGDAVEQVQLSPGEPGRIVRIGKDVARGERPQVVVERGIWQGARLAPGGRFALLGTTVAPGFDFADYVHGERAALSALWPDFAAMIAALTPDDPVVKA